MKISNRDKGILLGFFGFLLAVLAYVLVFNPMKLSNEALQMEVDSLKEREAALVDLEENMEFYKSEILVLTNQKDELIAEFQQKLNQKMKSCTQLN